MVISRPARLRELALVAHRASGRVPPSEGERLDAVRSALLDGSRVPLSSIGLCEDFDTYPAGWKRVLEHLPHQPIQFKAGAKPSSDLGKLQRVLAGGTAEPFSNDGSLRVPRPAAFGWSPSRPALQVFPLALALHRGGPQWDSARLRALES